MEENIYKIQASDTAEKLTTLKVENLKLRAYIGFQKWETHKLQDLVISYSFRYNAARAIESDLPEDAVNYKKITKAIIALVDRQKFHLLENLAEKIFWLVKSNPFTRDVCVRVEKPYALRFADNVLAEVYEKDRLNEAIIGLGSNIEPEKNIEEALAKIKGLGKVTVQTEFIYTKPEGYKEQPDFLNGALILNTDLPYETLHHRLKELEDEMGRDRSGKRYGPRNIDLDIAVYNGTITDHEVYEYDFLKKFVRELKPDLTFGPQE